MSEYNTSIKNKSDAATKLMQMLGVMQKRTSKNPTDKRKSDNDKQRRRTKAKHQSRSRKANNRK